MKIPKIRKKNQHAPITPGEGFFWLVFFGFTILIIKSLNFAINLIVPAIPALIVIWFVWYMFFREK